MKKKFIALFVSLFMSNIIIAQGDNEILKSWNFISLSEESIANLEADTDNWGWNTKGRYVSKFSTDGTPLKANGKIIAEYDGILIGSGVTSGNLLLWKSESSNNGMQMQNSAEVKLGTLLKDSRVQVKIKSSSKNSAGIKSIKNMTGDVGDATYTTSSYKTYEFTVKDDGETSFTPTAGVIIQTITVIAPDNREPVATPEIHVNGNSFTLDCPTPGADLYYCLVDHANAWDYGILYNGTVTPGRSCRIRAYATKEGMKRSEVAEAQLEVPLNLPYAGRPFVLDPEPLTRGVIATKATTGYLVNWRWLINDPADIAFNVYRNGTKLNDTPISDKTNYLDNEGKETDKYTVETISNGIVVETSEATMLAKGYLDISLNRPEGGETLSGQYEYVPGDCMVADVDGDHEYEIIMKWDPCNYGEPENTSTTGAGQKDNSQESYTGEVLIDGYRMDGTHLWRINLGRNIRAGAHYTQLMVYDLDGDGKAELACKTAPGTVDGKGNYVLMDGDDPNADYRSSSSSSLGHITSGPEYLTVFSGLTGEALATTHYQPAHNVISNAEWGDSYGNRSERYLAAVAYLDGEHPSLVMCRGYYTAAFLWAVDFNGNNLTTRWLHSSIQGGIGAHGEGAHTVQVADVDGDLRDEIIYGACAIDDDGTLIYRTGLGHGDAMHVGDLMPDRPGLEVMMVHEETTAMYGIEMHDALTGEHISGQFTGSDVGRGLCADVDENYRGCEYWGYEYNFYNAEGELLCTKRPSINFRTYWDGDLLEELTETGVITKWQGVTKGQTTVIDMPSAYGIGTNLIKRTPCLQADIFGDWREEQIYYDKATCSHLYIFSTPYATEYRVPCLMHDHHYRMATVWQTSAYNQPPHLSYYLPDYIKNQGTGIDTIEHEGIDNGNTPLFNLSGQRVKESYKGLVIKNGRVAVQN
ncbi:MAG: rhamnogalacturonan lyase [Prevotella sp.]